MLDNLEHLFKREIFSRLEPPVVSGPAHRCPIFSVGSENDYQCQFDLLELQQRIIDAIKEHFVVDVLAFSQEIGFVGMPSFGCYLSFPPFLSPFLKPQVEVKRDDWGEVLFEVFVAAYLAVLHLLHDLEHVLLNRGVDSSVEHLLVEQDFISDLIDVLLYCK